MASLMGVELVYFVRSGDFVKVGFTNNLPSRLGTLQTGSPYRIEVLGICEGSRQDEKDLHGYLERHRVGGEWFKLNHDQILGIGMEFSAMMYGQPFKEFNHALREPENHVQMNDLEYDHWMETGVWPERFYEKPSLAPLNVNEIG